MAIESATIVRRLGNDCNVLRMHRWERMGDTMTDEPTKTGRELERRVADAYRVIGARKVTHDVEREAAPMRLPGTLV